MSSNLVHGGNLKIIYGFVVNSSSSSEDISEIVENLMQMGMIQSALDIFPSSGQVYFGDL